MDVGIYTTQELIDVLVDTRILEGENKDILAIKTNKDSCSEVTLSTGASESLLGSFVQPAVVTIRSEILSASTDDEGQNKGQPLDKAINELRSVIRSPTIQSSNGRNCADIKIRDTLTLQPLKETLDSDTDSADEWYFDDNGCKIIYTSDNCSVSNGDQCHLLPESAFNTNMNEQHNFEKKTILNTEISTEFYNGAPNKNLIETVTNVSRKNTNDYYNGSNNHTKPCKILFHKKNYVDVHSQVTSTTSNKKTADRSTSKQYFFRNRTRKSIESELKCNIYSNKSINKPKPKPLAKHHEEQHSDVLYKKSNNNKCEHCGHYFDNQYDLIQHLYNSLNSRKGDSIASEKSRKKAISAKLFQCDICTFYVNNPESLKTHMKTFHKQRLIDAISVKFERECRFCGLLNDNHEKHNHHIRTNHGKLLLQQNSQAKSHDESFNQNNFENEKLVPSKILFKCCKCNINFFSCTEAILHSDFCTKSLQDTWECHKCTKLFHIKDQNDHLIQHLYSNSFEVHEARKDLLKIILCQCLHCCVNFSEINIKQHHETGCKNDVDAFYCHECDTLIENKLKELHEEIHEIFKLSRNDIIIVRFILNIQIRKFESDKSFKEIDISTKSEQKPLAIADSGIVNKHFLNNTLFLSFKLIYCKVCQIYMEVTNKLKNEHLNSNCKEIPEESCDVCGIIITQSDFPTHINIHNNFKDLELLDFQFMCLQGIHKISPPIPKYYRCSNCRVRFFNQCTLYRHKCGQSEYSICEICKRKFDIVVYKLHLLFHEYSIVSSLPRNCQCSQHNDGLILYFCDSCDMALDLYDLVIEHSQNHFSTTCEIQTNFCHICNIKFESRCYIRHEQLHNRLKNLTKDSFQILNYCFKSLASKNWFEMFTAIPRYVSHEILFTSIYKNARHVKMNITQDGPIELTLYKCAECSNYIDPKFVSNHSRNGHTCSKVSHTYDCKVCCISFFSEITRDQHQRIHDIPNINESVFRIITFNYESDRELNKLIRKVAFSFPKLNKSNRINVRNTNYKDMEEFTKLPKAQKTNDTSSILNNYSNKFNKKIKLYHYFKCNSCDVCVQNLKNTKNHYCFYRSKKKQCQKCGLCFGPQHFFRHILLHKNISSKFKTKITLFSPLTQTRNTSRPNGYTVNTKTKERIIKIFKCGVCNLHFYPFTKLEEHYCNTENKYSHINCNKCNRIFDKLSLDGHLSDHCNGINKFIVIEVKQNLYDTTVYRCSNCLVLFPSGKLLMEHSKTDCSLKVAECKICDNVFHPSMIISHISKHIETGDRKLNNIQILTINKNAVQKTFNRNEKVYKCEKCCVCFLNLGGIRYHFLRKHDVKRTFRTCNICGLRFACNSIQKHKELHEINNFKREDFTVISVDSSYFKKSLEK